MDSPENNSLDGDAEMVDESPEEVMHDGGEEEDSEDDAGDDNQNDDQTGDQSGAFAGNFAGAPQTHQNISDLHNPPPYLASMRLALFEINMPVELKPEEFELYWPFVDNVWVRQHKAGTDRSGRNTDYYACRLQRPTYAPKKEATRPEGKQRRIKQTREGGTCQMRVKTVRFEGEVQKVTISRIGSHSHSHNLDTMDKLKRNSVVMDIARSEVMKGFMPASVFTVMNADYNKLTTIGGKFLKTNDVRNASQAWRSKHEGKLVVHPGYEYDHGNGIQPAAQQNYTIDPNLGTSGPLPIMPPSHAKPFPLNTLHFPPHTAALFVPYLPPPSQLGPSTSLPHVTLTYATSMDSFLSLGPTIPTPISNLATKSMTHFLRSHHSAILVGVGTAIADDPTLNCRIAGAGGYGGLGWSAHPRPVVIDPGARWDLRPDSSVLSAVKEGRARAPWVIVAPGMQIPPARVELLRSHGGKYVALPDFDPRFRLRWEGILRALAEEGVRSVMVEGGGMVINELLSREENRKLINTVIVTIAPTYLGTGGVVVCPNRAHNTEGRPVPVTRFRDVRWYPFGEDVVMVGRLGDAPPPPPGMASLPGLNGQPQMLGGPTLAPRPGPSPGQAGGGVDMGGPAAQLQQEAQQAQQHQSQQQPMQMQVPGMNRSMHQQMQHMGMVMPPGPSTPHTVGGKELRWMAPKHP